MMSFKKYSSIENSYRTKFLNKIIEEGHGNAVYMVQEKVHGANFSFIVSDDGVQIGKRSGIIKDDESFFNANHIFDKYEDRIKKLFDTVKATAFELGTTIEYIQVYGELYGGRYEHPDVDKSSHSSVQREVQYCPEQDFIAFDIYVDDHFLGVHAAEAYFEKANIPFSKVLFSGKLEECLQFENEYLTTIPAMYGLPDIEGNVCEGNVIRHWSNNIYLWDETRLIIKNKNAKYAEKTKTKKPGKTKMPEKFPEHLQPMLDTANSYVNENRLRNVLSKHGEVTQKDFGRVVGQLTKDAIEDLIKDESSFSELSRDERSKVTKQMGRSCALLLRDNFANIIDGEF